jgi:hypothetical protein
MAEYPSYHAYMDARTCQGESFDGHATRRYTRLGILSACLRGTFRGQIPNDRERLVHIFSLTVMGSESIYYQNAHHLDKSD